MITPWLLVIALGLSQETTCPDLGLLLEGIDDHLVNGRFAEAEDLHRLAESTFSCGAPPVRSHLARFWLAKGTLEHLRGRRNQAVEAFNAAATIAPGVWNDAYGAKVRGVYEMSAVGISGDGKVDVDPRPEAPQSTWLDGNQVTLPATAPAGLHLFQVVDGYSAVFHDMVRVPEDSTTMVAFAPPEPPPEPRRRQLEPGQQRSKPTFLIASAAAGGLSGVAALGAVSQNGAMRRAQTVPDIEAAYSRQVGLAVTSYTLLGAAATGLVLQVAL